MDELLRKATVFLNEHPGINEVELSNAFGDKVKLVRITPIPIMTPPAASPGWPR